MKIISVDPGTNISAYSVFENGEVIEFDSVKSNEKSKTLRCEDIICRLFTIISTHKPDKVICEYPHKSGPGWKSKHIVILFHFCGMLHGVLRHHNVPVEFIEPSKWKGQIPKDKHHKILIPRFKKKYSIHLEGLDSDIVDAVGIGDWWLGKNS